jgi:hypothetical protein
MSQAETVSDLGDVHRAPHHLGSTTGAAAVGLPTATQFPSRASVACGSSIMPMKSQAGAPWLQTLLALSTDTSDVHGIYEANMVRVSDRSPAFSSNMEVYVRRPSAVLSLYPRSRRSVPFSL